MKVGLAGKLVETTPIRSDREQLDRNRRAGRDLVAAIKALGLAEDHPWRGSLYRAVPVDVVRDFLRVFRCDAADPLTDPRPMSDYIDARADGELKAWDVLLASAQKADATPDDLAGIGMRAFGRSVGEADRRRPRRRRQC